MLWGAGRTRDALLDVRHGTTHSRSPFFLEDGNVKKAIDRTKLRAIWNDLTLELRASLMKMIAAHKAAVTEKSLAKDWHMRILSWRGLVTCVSEARVVKSHVIPSLWSVTGLGHDVAAVGQEESR